MEIHTRKAMRAEANAKEKEWEWDFFLAGSEKMNQNHSMFIEQWVNISAFILFQQ